MTRPRPKIAVYSEYAIGILIEVGLTLALFAAGLVIVVILGWLVS